MISNSTEQIQDRREHRRLHVSGAVIFKYAGQYHKGIIENISLGGVCASSPLQLQEGAELALDIPLPNGDVAIVRAEVVRNDPGCAAMKFHWLDDKDRSLLLLKEVIEGEA